MEANIGNTPLLRLKLFDKDLNDGVQIFAKAEHLNPGGSVKDVERADTSKAKEAGDSSPGMTIIDATSGNTGIAYATDQQRGYRVTVCLPKNAGRQRKRI